MLNRLKIISDSLFKKSIARVNAPHVLSTNEHRIKERHISKGALDVVKTLSNNGYEAYVVGGCVRDLLLDLRPKDFDVATNATPEQVKKLFRRSRIIGRRFQIVHVMFGREQVEVTTFRADHSNTEKNSKNSKQSKQGMLLRDNIFGDINQDAARRDFTINALYYHPQDDTVYDYADGLADIDQRLIRIIGDAETRYREDPVRMLRAIRFAARLGFKIDEKTSLPIKSLSHLLNEVPAARMFDEVLKLLMNGYGLATFNLLREFGLFKELFPSANKILDEGDKFTHRFIEQALINTDLRIRTGKRVTPAFIYAAMLWPQICKLTKRNIQRKDSLTYAAQHAATSAIEQQLLLTAIPRRFTTPMREIWDLQHRLVRRNGHRAESLVQHPRFRAGYDFVLLREEAGEHLDGLGVWWTRYQEVDADKRAEMVKNLGTPNGPRRRRKRKPRKKTTSKPNVDQGTQ
jgi:poly(A) polymerase